MEHNRNHILKLQRWTHHRLKMVKRKYMSNKKMPYMGNYKLIPKEADGMIGYLLLKVKKIK